MALVSLTRLRLRSWRHLLPFAGWVAASVWQSLRAEGLLHLVLLRDRRNTFWTYTVWRDQSCMEQFRRHGSHGQAMRHLANWCDESAVVHWQDDGTGEAALRSPDWYALHGRLISGGHYTALPHPSAAHQSHNLPEPACGRGRVIRLR